MRHLKSLFVAVVILASVRDGAMATSSPMPRQLVGSWEGIGEDEFRVFKMEIDPQDAKSLVAMTAGRAKSVTLLFKVNRIDVRDGRFELDAAGADGPDHLRVRGRVKRFGTMSSEGAIDAKIMLVNEKSRVINTWHVVLLNYGGDYLSRLCQLSADATARIDGARKAER